jgi:hypothetical protein
MFDFRSNTHSYSLNQGFHVSKMCAIDSPYKIARERLENKFITFLGSITNGPSTSKIYEMIEDPRYRIVSIDRFTWQPFSKPTISTLEGSYVNLIPLDVEKYGDELYNSLNFPNFKQFFRYFSEYPPSSRENFQVIFTNLTIKR